MPKTKQAPKNSVYHTQQLFIRGNQLFRKHWLLLFVLLAIPFVLDAVLLSTAFSDVQDLVANNTDIANFDDFRSMLPRDFWLYIVISLISGTLVSAALVSALLRIVRGKTVSLGWALNAGLERFWDVFSLSLVIMPLVAFGLFVLILPGFILGYFLMFSIHARIDKNLSVAESMRLSYEKARNNWRVGVLMIVGFAALALGVDIVNRMLTQDVSNLPTNIWYTLVSIPLSAYIALVFTVAYVEFKADPKKVTG